MHVVVVSLSHESCFLSVLDALASYVALGCLGPLIEIPACASRA